MVEPDCVTDDIGRESVTLVVIHYPIIDQQLLTCQYPWRRSYSPERYDFVELSHHVILGEHKGEDWGGQIAEQLGVSSSVCIETRPLQIEQQWSPVWGKFRIRKTTYGQG